jgi:hypothetical protein
MRVIRESMAQYTPKSASYFDVHWQPRLSLGSKVLSDAQNSWLLNDSTFPSELISAILLWVFRFDFHATGFIGYVGATPKELHGLKLNDWRDRVRSPECECRLLIPNASDSQLQLALDILNTTIDDALSCWDDDPLSPHTDAVVLNCVERLAEHNLLKLR